MYHTSAELRDRARQCRERAAVSRDPEVKKQLLQIAAEFEEEATRVERQGTFEDGYRDGWLSVSGNTPLPHNPTPPPPDEPRTYDNGFRYGRGDALERFELDH